MTESEYYNVAGNAAALFGNMAGMFSTNSTNKKLMREQMRFNENMMQKQMDYNWDMYNAQNAYNHPSQQRLRLEEAGINPYLALQHAQPVQAQGGSVSPASAPGVTPMLAPNFDGLARIGETIYNSEARELALERQRIDNQRANEDADFEKKSHVIDLLSKGEDLEDKKWKNVNWFQQTDWWNKTYNDRFDLQRATAQNAIADLGIKEKQNIALGIQNRVEQLRLDNLPKEFAANMALLAAQRYASIASGAASYSQVTANLALAAKTNAEEVGIQINNKQARAIATSAIWSTIAENNNKMITNLNSYQSQQDIYNMFNNPHKFYELDTGRGLKTVASGFIEPFKGVFR